MGLLAAIPRWILVLLVVLLLIFLFSTGRTLTIGEGSSSPDELSLPSFITGLVPTSPPVPPRDVVAPQCRSGATLSFSGSCTLLVDPVDERRRLTLVREQGSMDVTVRFEPEGDDDPESYEFPQDDETRAEFGVPDDRQLQVRLDCDLLVTCVLRIEAD